MLQAQSISLGLGGHATPGQSRTEHPLCSPQRTLGCGMTAAIKSAAAYRLGKVRRVDALVSQGRPISDALRIVLLAGAPALAVAALVIWVERGLLEMNEAPQRHSA